MVPVKDLRPGGATADQVMTFAHELSEARPLRGSAAVARAHVTAEAPATSPPYPQTSEPAPSTSSHA
ncbi:unnamed protein product, partial [Brenthis ino]